MEDDKSSAVRKLLIPTAASVAGAGAGLILTRKQRTKLRDSLPSLNGVGDLAEDLRAKVGSLLEKTPVPSGSGGSEPVPKLAPSELEDRRREREQHRAHRRAKS